MSQIQMKINHLHNLQRTVAQINRRIEVLEKEINRDLNDAMLQEYAKVRSN